MIENESAPTMDHEHVFYDETTLWIDGSIVESAPVECVASCSAMA